jgi:spore coat protein CotH
MALFGSFEQCRDEALPTLRKHDNSCTRSREGRAHNSAAMKQLVIVSLVLLSTLVAPIAGAQWGGGRGFGGGGVREDVQLRARYDKDKDGVLNAKERGAALTDFGFEISNSNTLRAVPAAQKLVPAQVRTYNNEALYDPLVVRTLFLSFDTATWEDELAVFKNSDVKVPATLVVDGKSYRDVGVSFRGQTSFMMVSAGQKRSMNLDIDFRHQEQKLLGNTKLTLLNSAGDAAFLRSVMYMHIARDYYPAFKANYMRVVINGENWGIYINQQPADEVFAMANGGSTGPIWKTPGSPRGRAGLDYLGEDVTSYQSLYELNHKGPRSKAEAWAALVKLCRVLNQTPLEKLPAALAPLLDVDATLRFLAVDNALMNSDGYWTRASDYNAYIDATGRFHLLAHDVNETMREEEMGFGGGRRRRSNNGGGGSDSASDNVSLDPLAGADDPNKALLYRLLQVPEYKQKYLGYMRDVTQKWLVWERFGAVAAKYQALVADDVKRDIRKLYSNEAFVNGLANDMQPQFEGRMGPSGMSLKTFVEKRHAFLVKALAMPAR